MMAVAVTIHPTFTADRARVLFEERFERGLVTLAQHNSGCVMAATVASSG